jgi:hypothetical protein
MTTTGSPFFAGTVIGTIWPSNRPASIAATALCWEARAKVSCRSRSTDQRSATLSAVSPIEYG